MLQYARNRWGHCLVALGLAALVGVGTAEAQEIDANIVGRVVDDGGGVLPGATVTAKSPALLVPEVTAVTSTSGDYRLSPLPIGTYEVTYELPGFSTARRDGIRLTVGFTARVDVQLKVGGLQETITVSGAAPVVDVTSTSSTNTFTREALELIPTSRSGVISLLAQTPGVRGNVDIGGSQFASTPQFRVFGQLGQHYDTLEGVLTASPKTSGGQGGNYYSYGAIEEVSVKTIGSEADNPNRGILMNTVVKSGGNTFGGNGSWTYSGQRFQSNNITPELKAAGIQQGAPIDEKWELGFSLGGPLIRNRLWFFTNYEYRPLGRVALNTYKPDGSPAVNFNSMMYQTDKVSFQINPSNKVIGFYQYARKKILANLDEYTPFKTIEDGTLWPKIGKVEWQSVISKSLVASLQYGQWRWDGLYVGHDPGVPAWRDIGDIPYIGGDNVDNSRAHEWRHHTTGTLSWFKPNAFQGDHEIKTGFDYMASTVAREWRSRGASGDYQLVFRNGVPDQIVLYNYPAKPLTATNYVGLYIKDNWSLSRRLTVNAGVRYANDNGFVPKQCKTPGVFQAAFNTPECIERVQFKVWNTFTPRLSFAYDLTNDAKTVLKGGWGRFERWRQIDDLLAANPMVAATGTYRWHDTGDRDYDPGEVNLDPNGGDFLSSGVRDGGFPTGEVVNPAEIQPTTDQFSASIERELIPDFAVRFTGIHSRNYNPYLIGFPLRPSEAYNVPVTNRDPGPDGVAGNGDDGDMFTYWEYPAQYSGKGFEKNILVNGDTEKYSSFEIAGTKRYSRNWQMMASYSATKKNIPLAEKTQINPNALINTADNSWEWSGKLAGSVGLPAALRFAANYEHRSGEPWARTVQFRGGRTIPNIVLSVEPLGTHRHDNLNILDLRLERAFRLGSARRLSARLNVYNALNSSTVTGRTNRSGPIFGRPTAIIPPRIAEFGLSYDF